MPNFSRLKKTKKHKNIEIPLYFEVSNDSWKEFRSDISFSCQIANDNCVENILLGGCVNFGCDKCICSRFHNTILVDYLQTIEFTERPIESCNSAEQLNLF